MKKTEWENLLIGDRVELMKPHMAAGRRGYIVAKLADNRAWIDIDGWGERKCSFKFLKVIQPEEFRGPIDTPPSEISLVDQYKKLFGDSIVSEFIHMNPESLLIIDKKQQEFVFTYRTDKDWKLETISSYLYKWNVIPINVKRRRVDYNV